MTHMMDVSFWDESSQAVLLSMGYKNERPYALQQTETHNAA